MGARASTECHSEDAKPTGCEGVRLVRLHDRVLSFACEDACRSEVARSPKYAAQLREAARRIESLHGSNAMLVNLGGLLMDGSLYALFRNNCVEFRVHWDRPAGIGVPPLDVIFAACASMENWMELDPENVVVLHTRGGMNSQQSIGFLRFVAACFLTFRKEFEHPIAALKSMLDANMPQATGTKAKGSVSLALSSTPSQRRYYQYLTDILRLKLLPKRAATRMLRLQRIVISHHRLPCVEGMASGGIQRGGKLHLPSLVVYVRNIERCCCTPTANHQELVFEVDQILHGDVAIAVWTGDKNRLLEPPLFSFAFHTVFAEPGIVRVQANQIDTSFPLDLPPDFRLDFTLTEADTREVGMPREALGDKGEPGIEIDMWGWNSSDFDSEELRDEQVNGWKDLFALSPQKPISMERAALVDEINAVQGTARAGGVSPVSLMSTLPKHHFEEAATSEQRNASHAGPTMDGEQVRSKGREGEESKCRSESPTNRAKPVPPPPPPPPPMRSNKSSGGPCVPFDPNARGGVPPPPPKPPMRLPSLNKKGTAGPPIPAPPLAPNRAVRAARPGNRTRLRALYWTKLHPHSSGEGTIWYELQPLPPLHEAEYAATCKLFALQDGPRLRNSKGGPPLGQASTLQFLPPRRANNIAIMLTQFKSYKGGAVGAVHAALFDGLKLPLEKLALLVQIFADRDEIAAAASYQGSVEELTYPEYFLVQLATIPRLQQKVQTLVFMGQFQNLAADIIEGLEFVTSGCEELRGSRTFREILGIILAVGNDLNAETIRGNAIGVNLDVLLKLTDVKITHRPSSSEAAGLLDSIGKSVRPVDGPIPDPSSEVKDGRNEPASCQTLHKTFTDPKMLEQGVTMAIKNASNLLEFVAALAYGRDLPIWDLSNELQHLKECRGHTQADLEQAVSVIKEGMLAAHKELKLCASGEGMNTGATSDESKFAALIRDFESHARTIASEVEAKRTRCLEDFESLRSYLGAAEGSQPDELFGTIWSFVLTLEKAHQRIS